MIIQEPMFNGYIVQCACGCSFHMARHSAVAECLACGRMASAIGLVARFAVRRTAPKVDLYHLEAMASDAAREAWSWVLSRPAEEPPS